MKQCTICGELKELSCFYFALDKGIKRYKSACKECMKKKAIKHYHKVKGNELPPEEKKKDKVDLITKFLDACDYNPDNLDTISKDKFRRCFKVEEQFDFEQLKKDAYTRLESLGYCNPDTMRFYDECYDGDYLIIGDTFGKKTSTDKFKLLQRIVNVTQARAVIAIGHNTDDYNDVSNAFGKFTVPVYFIPIKSELKDINSYCQQDKNSSIVLSQIKIGDVIIRNQEHITPYVKTAISNLDPLIYRNKCIVNCTRHEYFSRAATFGSTAFIASPGAMAEPHVIRVAYKLTLTNGGRVNVTPAGRDSFLKYRKNDIDKELWECGCIIVNKHGLKTHIKMVRITEDENNKPSCVVNGMYLTPTSQIPIDPEFAILSDIHSPYADYEVFHHVKQILKAIKPRKIIINGDFMDCRSMNPHNPYEAGKCNLEKEVDSSVAMASALSELCDDLLILFGNHEDFIRRFVEQYPQLSDFILNTITHKLSEHATVGQVDRNYVDVENGITLTHGANNLYGVAGKQIEKLARSVCANTIMGHTHAPAIRFGVYCSGCLCDIDQGYNNNTTTNWQHGFIVVYVYGGRPYIQQVIFPK